MAFVIKHKALSIYHFENFPFGNFSSFSVVCSSCPSILVSDSPKQVMQEIQRTQHTHEPVKPL